MQVEINGEEKAVLASDIKVGDVITWGAHQDYYVKIDIQEGYMALNKGAGIVNHWPDTYMDHEFKDLRIVTDKCKLVVTL